MTEKKAYELCKKIFNKSAINNLADKIIIDTDYGYELYAKYAIKKTNHGYDVEKYNTHVVKNFYHIKTAFIWAILDKKNLITDSITICDLDRQLMGLDTNLEIYKNLVSKSKNYEAKMVYYSKLTEDKLKRRIVVESIESYNNQAKMYQNSLFNQAVK